MSKYLLLAKLSQLVERYFQIRNGNYTFGKNVVFPYRSTGCH